LTWPDLARFSLADIDEAMGLGLLEPPTLRDEIVDPQYGLGPHAVIESSGRYFVAPTAPDAPDLVEINEDRLRVYPVRDSGALELIALRNDMVGAIAPRPTGLWSMGSCSFGTLDYAVLFAPASFSGNLPEAVTEFKAARHATRVLLLVADARVVDRCAEELGRRGALALTVPEWLDDDLRVSLPEQPGDVLLEIDTGTRRARWLGTDLGLSEAQYVVLEMLAREPMAPVKHGDLAWIDGESYDHRGQPKEVERDVRKAIHELRLALVTAGVAIDMDGAKQMVVNVYRKGYQLALGPHQVRVIE